MAGSPTSKTLRQLAGWTGRGPFAAEGETEGLGGRGCDFNVPLPFASWQHWRGAEDLAGGGWPRPGLEWPGASWSRGLGAPGRCPIANWDGGWSSLGPEVARLLSSPVDSEGGERRTWLAGRWWPTVCAFVCP